MAKQPSGPEGPIGVWFILLFPCLFAAILAFVLVTKGSLNVFPAGRLIQFVFAVGILITFCTVMFWTLDRHNSVIQGVLIAVPYLILAGFAAIFHQSDFPNPRLALWVAVILLGGTALAGWGLAGKAIFLTLKNGLEQSALQEHKEKEQEEQFEQNEVAEYAKLENPAPLKDLLRFTWSRNDQVRRQARVRASRYPELDDNLIELLDQDNEEAISYIATVYENPPANLASAWGRMLGRKLKAWDTLQYDINAGTWEQNLKPYFVGAQKIQLAGGYLRRELLLWHEHLLKCKGLGNLAAFVKNLLKTKPIS
ncbi:hypothetical protein JW935_15170 [candidate division KSB1 bacterium]|nr:hypothetical protein [candidate division KSB1 bacterium]